MTWFQSETTLSKQDVLRLAQRFAEETQNRICKNPKKVLLLPPDMTRAHSGAGWITEELYKIFTALGADVYLIPTLGQHVPHTPEQNRWMFGSVPEERIHVHDWRGGVTRLGEVPADFVKEISHGKADWAIPVVVNSMLASKKWNLVLNVGQCRTKCWVLRTITKIISSASAART